MRHLLSVALLTLVYLFTLASFHPWDVALGIIFAMVVLRLFRQVLQNPDDQSGQETTPSLTARIAAFPLFCFAVGWEIVVATWYVAKLVLNIEPMGIPGIVAVPIGERSRLGVVVSSIATTLSPGTLLIDIDWEAGAMLIHVIDAGDPDAVRANHQRFYERYQRRVFP